MNHPPHIFLSRLALLAIACALNPLLAAVPLRVLIVSDTEAFRADYSAALQKGGTQVKAAALLQQSKF